jgi:hypothetical protein
MKLNLHGYVAKRRKFKAEKIFQMVLYPRLIHTRKNITKLQTTDVQSRPLVPTRTGSQLPRTKKPPRQFNETESGISKRMYDKCHLSSRFQCVGNKDVSDSLCKELQLIDIWGNIIQDYPNVSKRAVGEILLFATTYMCETGFPHYTARRTESKSKFHASSDMKLQPSSITHNIERTA